MNTVSELIDRYNINIFERYSDLKNAGKTNVTHYDLAKIFEYYTCIKLSQEFNQTFLEYDDIPPNFKEENKMSRNDTGIDCSNLIDTIVQCKLRKNQLTWGECGTFFGSQNIFDDDKNETIIRWKQLILSRNVTSSLSQNLKFRQQLFTDKTFKLTEMVKYCENLKQEDLRYPQLVGKNFELRDYQKDCIKLIQENTQNVIINLPTGTGKNSIIIYSMEQNLKYLIIVPRIILMEQLYDEIVKHKPILRNTIQLIGDGNNKFNKNKNITICVFNSINVINSYEQFDKIYIDEAHHINKPAIYEIEEEENDIEENMQNIGELTDDTEDEIVNIKTHTQIIKSLTKYNNNVYLSATIDNIDRFIRYEKDIRYMIDNKYLCDYQLKIPIFTSNATNKNIAEYIIGNYRDIIIYSNSRKEGKQINNIMNEILPNSCAYVDCKTPKKLRNEIIAKYKSGQLPFLVNVRILVEGFDAPITKGICFLHMPSSRTSIIQIIGRALRLYVNKTYANIILPFSTENDGKEINKFLKIIASNDVKIRNSYEKKLLGGHISLNYVNEENKIDNEEAMFRFEMIYNTFGVLQNAEQIWMKKFNELVAFINNNNNCNIPSKADKIASRRSLGSWFSNQKYNYKQKIYIMSNKNIYDIWTKFMDDYPNVFIDEENKWIINLNKLKNYINEFDGFPTEDNKLEENRKLCSWLTKQKQNYKLNKQNMKNENIQQQWKNFMEDERYYVYFLNKVDTWKYTFEIGKKYIDDNKDVPQSSKTDIKLNKLHNWFTMQKQSYYKNESIMTNPEIRGLWESALNDPRYKTHLLDLIDLWKYKLSQLEEHIVTKNTYPTKTCKFTDGTSMQTWICKQKTEYKNKNSYMIKNNFYNLWKEFTHKYSKYFKSNEESWKDNYKLLIEYIDKTGKTPHNSKTDEAIRKLSQWYFDQNSNYLTRIHIMKNDEIYNLWGILIQSDKYTKAKNNRSSN